MIQKFTVQRIAVDYYVIDMKELLNGRWDVIGSIGGQWPEHDLPAAAQARNPRTRIQKDGGTYTFYACVYDFPQPRLMGKFHDYTSSYGWDTPR